MKAYRLIIHTSLICLFCYHKTLEGNFVFDDVEAVVKNKDVLSETPVINIFRNDFWGTSILKNHSHKSYRPITVLSYRLNNFFSKETKPDPQLYHAVNIVLYTILCILFYYVFKMFYQIFYDETKSNSMAALTGLLYCVHPIHVEPVAAIVGRADLLCAIFYTTTLLIFKQFCLQTNFVLRVFYFSICFISTVLAMFSKETGITVFAVCVIYDIYLNRYYIETIFKLKPLLNNQCKWLSIRICLISLSTILLLYVRWWVMDFQTPVFQKMDNPASFSPYLLTKILTYNYIYSLNLILLIWPNWLCFDWAMGCLSLVSTVYDLRVLPIIGFWSIAVLFLLKFIKNSELFFPVILIVIPFLPASNIIRVGFVIAERTLLIPSAGFCMLTIIGFYKIKKCYPVIAYLAFSLLIITFVFKIHLRNNEWLTEIKLYKSALNVCPNNAKVHYNIAKIDADEGNIENAEREYRIALSLYPDYDHAMNNLANILRDSGKFDEAELLLKRSLELRPDFAAAWMNLGIVQMNKHQQKNAETSFMNALKYRSKYADCYYNLGNLYLDQKKHSKALSAWKTAIQLKPLHTVAWNNLLILLDTLGRTEESIITGFQAIKLLPNEPSLYFNVGNSLGKAQRWRDAEYHFQMAIRLNPSNALYYSNLGVLYHRWNKFEEAKNYYRIALRLNPNLKSANENLIKLTK